MKDNSPTVHKIGALKNMKDWHLPHQEKDIRNWDVITTHGDVIGTVEHLIADTEAKQVRYAEVKLNDQVDQYRDNSYRDQLDQTIRSHFGKEDDRHVLIPIGMLNIDEAKKSVTTSPNMTVNHISNAPRYGGIDNQAATPAHEWMCVKYFANLDDKDREVYNQKKYDFEGYRTTPYITDREFYGSDFFSRDRYHRRYRNRNNTMVGVDTGGPR